jgi:SAM-dependent methyltransferase
MPASLVGDAMRAGSIRDPEYFERLYTESEDPYGFDRNDYEQLKFERLLQLCGDHRFERALEIGCALGTFTEMLAPQCRQLVATDISAVAVKAASERLAGAPGVSCEVWNLPGELPPGEFDLIIVSDVLYFWTTSDLRTAVQWFEEALTPGGVLIAAHYLPYFGVMLTGEEAHDFLEQTTTLEHPHTERVEFGSGRPYRVDVYEKAEERVGSGSGSSSSGERQ